MNLLTITLTLLCIGKLSADDDEEMSGQEAFQLLCAADENHMEELYSYCQRTELKDAVDGVMQMCFIEIRNKRAPTTRLDAKYYQFVMCDFRIWMQFAQCANPKLRELQVSYDAYQNLNAFFNGCLIETLKAMKDEIEHQDDTPGTKKRNNNNNGKRNNHNNNNRPKITKNNNNNRNNYDPRSLKLGQGRRFK